MITRSLTRLMGTIRHAATGVFDALSGSGAEIPGSVAKFSGLVADRTQLVASGLARLRQAVAETTP
jgi:hypothetical protein